MEAEVNVQYCIEESTCDIVGTFRRPPQGFDALGIVPSLLPFVTPLTTCPNFDNPKFDISDAGGAQYHFITSLMRAGRFPHVHWHRNAKRFTSFLISTLTPLNLPMKSHSRRYQCRCYHCA